MSYQEDLEIDVYNLIEEWQTQAGLYMSYAEETADEQFELDCLKDKIDATIAEVSMEVRIKTYPLLPDGFKVTDKSIISLIDADPKIQKLRTKFAEQKKVVYISRKIEIAFEMRKKALENMVVLTGREQWSEPKDKTDTVEQQISKDSLDRDTKKLKEKLKR